MLSDFINVNKSIFKFEKFTEHSQQFMHLAGKGILLKDENTQNIISGGYFGLSQSIGCKMVDLNYTKNNITAYIIFSLIV